MTDALTPLERRVYLYLLDFLSEHTYQPSVRDIAAEFGIRSTKTVAALLQELERKGYVERESTRSRGLRLVGLAAPSRVIPVPRVLRLASEHPALRDENRDGYLTFDRRFIPNPDVFVYRIDAATAIGGRGILSGDYTLIDPSSPATDGSTVLARIGPAALIRTMNHRGAMTVLTSANTDEADIVLGPASDFEIVGVVCGLMRVNQDSDENPGANQD
jgi:repressor LexA